LTSKRNKIDIYSAILENIFNEGGRTNPVSPTRVAHRANIPYDRFQKIIAHLHDIDMINRTDDGLLITENGLNCLREFKKTNDFLKRIGLKI
jgi:predicted transcriptional regulator